MTDKVFKIMQGSSSLQMRFHPMVGRAGYNGTSPTPGNGILQQVNDARFDFHIQPQLAFVFTALRIDRFPINRSPEFQNRVNAEGVFVIYEQSERSQSANRRRVVEKIHELVARALRPRRIRVPTKTPRSVKENRLKNKKRRSAQKKNRQWRPDD